MTSLHVVVLDHGSGNVHSAVRALTHVGARVELTAPVFTVGALVGVALPLFIVALGVLLVCSSRLRWARSVSTRRISSRAAVIRARAASVSGSGGGVWSMLTAAEPPAFVGVCGGVQDSRRNRL